jgi:hypothetical protein
VGVGVGLSSGVGVGVPSSGVGVPPTTSELLTSSEVLNAISTFGI